MFWKRIFGFDILLALAILLAMSASQSNASSHPTSGSTSSSWPSTTPPYYLAFSSNRPPTGQYQIWEITGTNQLGPPLQITNLGSGSQENRWPDYSRTAGRLAYSFGSPGARGVHTITLTGRNDTRLTFRGDEESPSWSPDGKFIVYASKRLAETYYSLRIHNLDDPDDNTDVTYSRPQGIMRRPAWSPDGHKIAFAISGDDVGTDAEIAVVDVYQDENDRYQFQPSTFVSLTVNSTFDFDPTWSPDSQHIAYSRFPTGGNRDIYRLHMCNPPPGQGCESDPQSRRLTNNSAHDSYPSWSPDGESLAFTSERDNGIKHIFLMQAIGEIDGSPAQQITSGTATDDDPTWEWTPADLVVTTTIKRAPVLNPVFAGTDLTYSITVRNDGPYDATGVLLTFTYTNESNIRVISPCSNDSGTNTVTCALGDISHGNELIVTLIAATTEAEKISNRTTLIGNEPDSNVKNNNELITLLNVPRFAQRGSDWNDLRYDHAPSAPARFDCGRTIGDCGCELSSFAMILAFHGVVNDPGQQATSPLSLNIFCKANEHLEDNIAVGRCYKDGNVQPEAAALYSGASAYRYPGRPEVEWGGSGPYNATSLRAQINNLNPALIRVLSVGGTKSKGHAVVATGFVEREDSDGVPQLEAFYVNDPSLNENRGSRTRLDDTDLYGPFESMIAKSFRRTHSDLSSIVVAIAEPAQALITDPQGRRTGFDPGSGSILTEIPNSEYYIEPPLADEDGIDPPPTTPANYWIVVTYPQQGSYQIDVTSPPTMTSFALFTSDRAGGDTVNVGELGANGEPYSFSYDPTPQMLLGHVVWQGRPAQPNTLQQLPITLTLKLGSTEVNYPSQTTNISGSFAVTVSTLLTGTYTWRVKGPNASNPITDTNSTPGFLANSGTVTLTGSLTTNIEMGLMRAGDCNNDNLVTSVDFIILKNTFGKSSGQAGYDNRADFTGDQVVSSPDFIQLKNNFGLSGAPPIGP